MQSMVMAGVILVGGLHIYFMVLEMFLWTKPIGLKTFRQSPEQAKLTAALAANQGLYNGFLAAGLLWGAYLQGRGLEMARPVEAFFLGCVVVAGIYGAWSVSRKILYVQALPAAIVLGLLALT